MPKAFPLEFRRDVVAVARRKEAPLSQIAQGLRDLAVVSASMGETSRDRRRRARRPDPGRGGRDP
jgi:hypothetical protein